MKLISNLHDIDRKAVSQAGILAVSLMEAAGEKAANAIQAKCKPDKQGVILCGPGNNGGDGFVCARKLYEAGYQNLIVIYTTKTYRNEALVNFEKLMLSLPIPLVDANAQPELALRHIEQAAFIVDALFGSGLVRPLAGLEAKLVEAVNRQRKAHSAWVLAVDLPSGIDGLNGQVLGVAVEADETVTFAAAKPGLYLQPGKQHSGFVSLVDIGIPQGLMDEDESPYRLITLKDARTWLPLRMADSHKYSHGSVLVIAGSSAMPGAAVLCSEAAMKAGAGLVTLAAPASVFAQLPIMPEIMRLPLPDRDHLGDASVSLLKQALSGQKYNMVLLGPGLGRDSQTVQVVASVFTFLKTLDIPVVVDADGLYALSVSPMKLTGKFILTPHIGEAARLLDEENGMVSADVLQAAEKLSEQYEAQVVLKSASTVIATFNPVDKKILTWITPTGNPGMATAGSGDVLAGIIGALAAQIQAQKWIEAIWQAAPLGVFLHGLAGDAASENLTPYCMTASRIIEDLPQAFRQVINP